MEKMTVLLGRRLLHAVGLLVPRRSPWGRGAGTSGALLPGVLLLLLFAPRLAWSIAYIDLLTLNQGPPPPGTVAAVAYSTDGYRTDFQANSVSATSILGGYRGITAINDTPTIRNGAVTAKVNGVRMYYTEDNAESGWAYFDYDGDAAPALNTVNGLGNADFESGCAAANRVIKFSVVTNNAADLTLDFYTSDTSWSTATKTAPAGGTATQLTFSYGTPSDFAIGVGATSTANFAAINAIRITVHATSGATGTNLTITSPITACKQDFGDAPQTYGTTLGSDGSTDGLPGPWHFVSAELMLGSSAVPPDLELDGLPAATGSPATGDDLNQASNDENGLASFLVSAPGTGRNVTANITVTNNAVAGTVATVCGWIDSNVNGKFEATTNEQYCTTVDGNGSGGPAQAVALGPFGGFLTDGMHTTYARLRVCWTASECNTPYGLANSGEVEDHSFQFNFSPTSAIIGKVSIDPLTPDAALTALLGGAVPTDAAALWGLLAGLDPDLAATLMGANAAALRTALLAALDPNGDGLVALLRWETLAENGTIGFDVERRPPGGAWQRFNNQLLPGLLVSSAGGEYALIDPAAVPGQVLEYQIIEQEAGGVRNTYGPYAVTMTPAAASVKSAFTAASVKTAFTAASVKTAFTAGAGSVTPGAALPVGAAAGDWRGLGQGYIGHARAANAPLGVTRRTNGPAAADARTRFAPAVVPALPVPAKSPNQWLYTAGAGLYRLTATQITALTGKPLGQVRQLLKAGAAIALTHDGARTPWVYDTLADGLVFSALDFRNLYTTRDAFRLSFGAPQPPTMGLGTTIAPRPGNPGEIATTQVRLEQDVYYKPDIIRDNPAADYWFQDYLYPNLPTKAAIQVPLTLPGLVPAAGSARLDIRLQGMTDVLAGNDHHVSAALAGDLLGAVQWDGPAPATLSVALNSAQLARVQAGTPLVLQSANRNSVQWLDAIDVTYPRTLRADAGRLLVRGLPAGVHTVSGFAGPDIRVVAAPGTSAATWYTKRTVVQGTDGWQVSFTSPRAADFLIVAGSTIAAPTAIVAEGTTRLRNPKRQADYLIIAPTSLARTAAALRAWRLGQYPQAQIAWLPDIEQQFGNGRPGVDAIDAFLEYVAANWQTAPGTVVLLGRGTLDHRDLMAFGNSVIPVPMVATPWGLVPSDYRYAESAGVIRFALGRIPVVDETEGLAYVAKLQAAETMPLGVAANTAVVVADNPDAAGDFHANADLLGAALQTDGYVVRPFYRCAAGDVHPACTNVRAALTQSSTWEAALLNFEGHGALMQLGDWTENFLATTDVPGLGNGLPPVFSALTCLVGGNFYPQWRSLTENLVLRAGGGAIAALAPSGQSLDGDAQLLGRAFTASLVAGAGVGEATRNALNTTRGQISPFMEQIYQVTGEPAVRLP